MLIEHVVEVNADAVVDVDLAAVEGPPISPSSCMTSSIGSSFLAHGTAEIGGWRSHESSVTLHLALGAFLREGSAMSERACAGSGGAGSRRQRPSRRRVERGDGIPVRQGDRRPPGVLLLALQHMGWRVLAVLKRHLHP